jgi:hypothetical protein
MQRRILSAGLSLAVVVAGLMLVSASPAAAHHNDCPPGADELIHRDWPAGCRDNIIDPGHQFIDRALLLQNQALLTSRQADFTPNFLWYSSETQVTVTDPDTRWSSCRGVPGIGHSCTPERVEANHHADLRTLDPPNSVLRSFHSDGGPGHPYSPVTLSVFEFGGMWISRVCGNWHDIAERPNPVPNISGVKFRDADRDGTHDQDEGVLEGWQIRVVRESSHVGQDGGIVATLRTDPAGRYRFDLDGHGPGRYRVEEVVQDGWKAYTAVSRTVDVPFGARDASYAVDFGNAETTTDVRKAEFSTVSPPSRMEIGQPASLHVRSVVANDGPAGPIEVEEALSLVSKPDDCQVEGLPPRRLVVLDVGESATFDELLTVTCSKRSDHPFAFHNDIVVVTPDVTDVDSSNNQADIVLSIPVFEQTQLALDDLSIVCDQYWMGNTFSCAAHANVANVGQAPDVKLLATLVLEGGEGCSTAPSRSQTSSLVVGANSDEDVAAAWTVTCPDNSLRTFRSRVGVQVDEPHLEAAPVSDFVTWVPLDIKPNSDPNSLNIGRPGIVSVALLSTVDLDATTAIDRTTLRWGPTGAEAEVARCGAAEDANGDGLLDLVCKFSLAEAEFSAGDTLGLVTGLLVDGTGFVSADRVRII